MKKRMLSFALIICIIASLFVASPITANAKTEGIYTYTVTDGEATITDCDESASGEIRIPSSLDGYPVTSIGDGAFEFCANLTQINIPESITSIGDRAFYGCTGVAYIFIQNSMKKIGDSAFLSCDGIETLFYNGTEEMWEAVDIGGNNECLTNAEISFKEWYFLGDANGDSRINVKDVISIRNFVTGGYGDIIVKTASDTNDDGKINVKDIVTLRRYIVGGYGVELMKTYDSKYFKIATDIPASVLTESDDKVQSVKVIYEGKVDNLMDFEISNSDIFDFDISNFDIFDPETGYPEKISPDDYEDLFFETDEWGYVIWQ